MRNESKNFKPAGVFNHNGLSSGSLHALTSERASAPRSERILGTVTANGRLVTIWAYRPTDPNFHLAWRLDGSGWDLTDAQWATWLPCDARLDATCRPVDPMSGAFLLPSGQV